MANPKVRPHLYFYPEDSYPRLEEARQGIRWLHELPADQTTPMARIDENDYFIYEPTLLRSGQCCIPVQYFMRDGALFAKCWKLEVVNTEDTSGWRVIKSDDYEVHLHDFMKNFVELKSDAALLYNLPCPSIIMGLFYYSHHTCGLIHVQMCLTPLPCYSCHGHLLIPQLAIDGVLWCRVHG
jgi:hypothetical protein